MEDTLRLPNAAHESYPWRIRKLVPDFTLEDVWALPVHGSAGDFRSLVELIASLDPTTGDSLTARALWKLRDLLGRWLDIGQTSASADAGGASVGEKLPIPGTTETSLAGRLPDDLRNTVADWKPGSLPFSPLFCTDREYAAEISNRTVFGVVHLAWADRGEGRYQGQMAVYVKPRGLFGGAYMTLIRPFRYWIVYPALMRGIQRAWNARRDAHQARTTARVSERGELLAESELVQDEDLRESGRERIPHRINLNGRTRPDPDGTVMH